MLANLPQLRSLLEDEREDNLGPVSKELRRLMLLRDGTTESLQTLRSLVADSLRRWPGEEITQDYVQEIIRMFAGDDRALDYTEFRALCDWLVCLCCPTSDTARRLSRSSA